MFGGSPFFQYTPLFNGIEVDMLSLGDADCIVVTHWHDSFPHRVLIDGGKGSDAEVIIDFLISRRYTDFWAAVCTHPHNDHASGLIKIVQNRAITIRNGWMHDIRAHVGFDPLRRAAAADAGVKDVLETTRELASAFATRNIPVHEPFAGTTIAGWPQMTVLAPSRSFYQGILEKFTNVSATIPVPLPNPLLRGTGLLGAPSAMPGLGGLFTPSNLIVPPPSIDRSALFKGALSTTTVKQAPSTQPFNNTSTVLGMVFNGKKFLFTADAGSDNLDQIPPEWRNLKWMQVPHHGSDGNLSKSNIERFCPELAYISACGDSSHPSRAIVNGLIKVGAQVFSTHSLQPGHLWFKEGVIPPRNDYGPAIPLKATGDMKPFDWTSILSGTR